MSIYVRNRRSGGRFWAVTGIIGFLAAAGVTAAGGGVDDPAGGTCEAHHEDAGGCNPHPGTLLGRCVVLQGPAWTPSTCTTEHAIPAAVGRAGDFEARPALAGCGLTGVEAAMATIRTQESGGNYLVVNTTPGATGRAAGAYQFTTDTWAGYAGFATADQAPPAVQDAKARQNVEAAMGGTGDVGRVPVVWYVGHVPAGAEWDRIPAPGNFTTPRQYQRLWLETFARVSSSC